MQHLNEPAFSSKQIEEALLSRSTLIRKVRALLDYPERLSEVQTALDSGPAARPEQVPDQRSLLLREASTPPPTSPNASGAVRRIARRVSETISPRASGKLPIRGIFPTDATIFPFPARPFRRKQKRLHLLSRTSMLPCSRPNGIRINLKSTLMKNLKLFRAAGTGARWLSSFAHAVCCQSLCAQSPTMRTTPVRSAFWTTTEIPSRRRRRRKCLEHGAKSLTPKAESASATSRATPRCW